MTRRNGLVSAWYHPNRAPDWGVPEVSEWSEPGWTEPTVRSFEVRTHAQEMAENTVDSVHFHFAHGTPKIPDMKAEIDGHILRAHQGLTFTTPRVNIQVHGPGFGVARFQGVVDTLLMITGIPLDVEHHRSVIRFVVKKIDGNEQATRGVAEAFVNEITRQYSQDIPIWENKRYLEKPLLSGGGRPPPRTETRLPNQSPALGSRTGS